MVGIYTDRTQVSQQQALQQQAGVRGSSEDFNHETVLFGAVSKVDCLIAAGHTRCGW